MDANEVDSQPRQSARPQRDSLTAQSRDMRSSQGMDAYGTPIDSQPHLHPQQKEETD